MLLKLTGETNLTSIFNNRFITDQFVGLGMESKALVHCCSKTHVPWGRC